MAADEQKPKVPFRMAGVLDALASYVQSMLTEMATQELHMLLGVSGQIDNMDVKLGDLKNFLADVDRRSITDQSVQAWVRELRGALYDATDIIDLCQLKAMERGPTRDAGCLNPLLFCMRNPLHAHDIGSRIKHLNQKLDIIKERGSTFGFLNLGSYEDRSRKVASSHLASRETSAELNESDVVGERIQEDTRNLVEMLTKVEETSCQSNKIMVFAIVGVGGIGKTTLAKKIFNDNIIQQVFTKKVWLSINQYDSPTELLRRAIIDAGGDHQAAGNIRSALERTLKETLMGHKTLLVMDDVWDHQAWVDVLKTPLVNVLSQGSRALVTTRNDTVARRMMAKVPYHRIDKLQPEDAWSLLRKQVVGNENDEVQIDMLKDIGMQIIEKCECLPLAVKVMGGLLCQKETRRRDWENVLNDSIRSVSQMPAELNYAIYLSYEDLHPSLKPCFLHYSLLPKSTLFFVDDIIGMWISEGFVHGKSRDLEELGREYYDELILRNLIEPDITYTDQKVCNMHDVVRSFGQYVARDEALVAHNSEKYITGKLNSERFIRLSLKTKGSDEPSELEWSSLQAQISLRTLIFVGHIMIKPGDSLVSFSSLRTLHVQYGKFDALAESLYQLKHLRYLSIKYTDTSELPENIDKMKFLQYISLLGCKSLVKLPGSIRKLRHLRFLNLYGTSINNIPRGFHSLTNLRKLYGFLAYMEGGWCSLEELGPLCQLTELGILGLENVSSSSFATKGRLDEKVRLRYLSLDCTNTLGDDSQLVKKEEEQQRIEEVFDELCPPPCLETLGIRGYFGQRLPRWMMSTAAAPLGSLRNLMMEDLPCCTELPDGLCQLPCLDLLQIVRAPAIKRVGPEFVQPYHHRNNRSHVAAAAFTRLRKLEFIGMTEWEEWEWEEQVRGMPILELLWLERCKLRRVPPGLAFHARVLRRLYVYNVEHLRSLENFASVVDLHVFESPDLESISNLPKLQRLAILKCPKLKVLEGVPALQRLNLVDYDMEKLPGYLQDVNSRHILIECSLSLLTSIAAGKSSPEWDKFSHIQQVQAYAEDEGIPWKWYVLYTRDPFNFETNISRFAIARARLDRAWFASSTCSIGEELPVGRRAYADKRQPLCQRFRCNAYRHLLAWLRGVCLHCNEATGVASSSDQWIQGAAAYPAGKSYMSRYGRLQKQKETSRV